MKKSNFLNLNFRDVLKALIIVALAGTLERVNGYLSAGRLPNKSELWASLIIGLKCGSVYLLKNFLTNSRDFFLSREQTPN